MIPHLQGREKELERLGWTGRKAEWIALACLHGGGLFTRAQLCFHLQENRWQALRFVQALVSKGIATEDSLENQKVCRIFSRQIYRALGTEDIRHRRVASLEILLRRLLALDYVLEHPGLPWLPTEPEKVRAFEALGIERRHLPLRVYRGAVEEAHLNLWRRLRAGGRQVRVVAVAWEPSLLTRAGKDSQDEDAPDTLGKAIAEGDWETIEQHGGLNEVMSRIGKRAEGGRIDGFTLVIPAGRRSRRCGCGSRATMPPPSPHEARRSPPTPSPGNWTGNHAARLRSSSP
jgi:hypothetical protein